jgi:inosine/xanthosine triphosphatase
VDLPLSCGDNGVARYYHATNLQAAISEKPLEMSEKIIVASTNPVKIQAALSGFQKLFPGRQFSASGVSVLSGVSAQPMTSDETFQGALNRARAASDQAPDADYWVGIEGGVEEIEGDNNGNGAMEVFAWVVVLSRQRAGRIGKGRTGTFYLPQEVIRLVRQGIELGEADDIVFGRSNSKQQNGSVGLLTDDVITRGTYYEHAVILALIPFKNAHLDFA